jgi:dTDP-4-dehydrorhamnose reductase
LLPNLGKVIAPERKELDLADPDQIREVVRSVRPDLVVNAAAYTAVDTAESDAATASAINSEAPRLLALEAKSLGAILLHFSTDYVFDGCKGSPYVETDHPNPVNCYGRTKLAGEEAIRNSGAAHLIFRTSWVYATHGRNFLLTMLRLATERKELKIVNDQVGSPTCAFDLAQAISRILTGIIAKRENGFVSSGIGGTYHMTAAGQTTWYEFAKAFLTEATHAPEGLSWLTSATHGRPLIAREVLPISTQEFRSPACRPLYSVLSSERLKHVFGVSLSDWRTQLRDCFSVHAHS